MEHVYQLRVRFSDTDAAGMVHFSRLLCYAEEAEHDLLKKLGIPLLENGGWPRVKIQCTYEAPISAGDMVEVFLRVEKMGNSSVSWDFTIRCNEKNILHGKMKTVRVDHTGSPVALDERWREMLSEFLIDSAG